MPGNRLYQRAAVTQERLRKAREEKRLKETEVMRDPIINKKYANKVSKVPLTERMKFDAKAKEEKLKRLKADLSA